MTDPSFVSSYFRGDLGMRLLQGLALGAVVTVAIGFGVGGWNLGSTVEQKVEIASRDATIAALAPICAARFETAGGADSALITDFKAVNAWDRSRYLMQAGWVTFVGAGDPNYEVASACASLVTTALKIE